MAGGMNKSPDAFRTISEVAIDLDVPQHVLRFWETRFPTVRPLKRGGGRRYYRPDDVDLLKGIRQLLYGQGYTIRGVQRILKEDGPRLVQSIGRGEQRLGAERRDEIAEGFVQSGDDAGEDEASRDGPETLAEASAPGIPERPRLDPDSRRRLELALDELVECDRILGTLRTES